MKKLFSLALIATSVALLSACSPDEDNKVKVAINTGPDEAIWKVVEQVAKDKYHLDVEVVSFNDYVLPNEALNNKDVDANAFQTLPYLEAQSKERGYKFAVVGKTFVFPIAAYSHRIKNISELPEGATVTISNETTTLGRSLLLLQAQGLLKLKPGVGYLPTTLDIIDNPKQLKIVEVDTPQLTRRRHSGRRLELRASVVHDAPLEADHPRRFGTRRRRGNLPGRVGTRLRYGVELRTRRELEPADPRLHGRRFGSGVHPRRRNGQSP